MKAVDLTEKIAGYEKQWVALDSKTHEVVCSAPTYQKVIEKLPLKKQVVLLFVS